MLRAQHGVVTGGGPTIRELFRKVAKVFCIDISRKATNDGDWRCLVVRHIVVSCNVRRMSTVVVNWTLRSFVNLCVSTSASHVVRSVHCFRLLLDMTAKSVCEWVVCPRVGVLIKIIFCHVLTDDLEENKIVKLYVHLTGSPHRHISADMFLTFLDMELKKMKLRV